MASSSFLLWAFQELSHLFFSKPSLCPHPHVIDRSMSESFMHNIILCTQFKFFSLIHFYDILMKMVNFFLILVKFISRHVNTWSLIPKPFWYQDRASEQPASAASRIPSLIWVCHIKKGSCSISEQYSVGSFLDWFKVITGFFTHGLIQLTHTLLRP